MGKTRNGFLLVELAMATAVFGGALLVMVVFLKSGTDLVRQQQERVTASCRAAAVLDAVRHAEIGVREGGTVEAAGPAGLSRGKCTVEVKPWSEDSRLCEVTVRAKWRSTGGRESSFTMGTLVRKERLNMSGGKP